MPDFLNTRVTESAPEGWSEAFATLPLETPPGDGWSRISHVLDAHASRHGAARRERRMSWLIGIASAAVLVLAAWSPLSRWLQGDEGESHPPVVATATPGMRGPAAPVRSAPAETPVATSSVASDTQGADSSIPPAPIKPVHRKSTRSRTVAKHSPAPSDAAPTAQIAASTATGNPDATITETTTSADPLQRLKAQSAQLEALVSLARDDRVANASSELLSSELDAGIATVDAALSQADVTDTRRQELWQQRVDLLQQLAGIEATSRWLAAQGASNDTTLVSVD